MDTINVGKLKTRILLKKYIFAFKMSPLFCNYVSAICQQEAQDAAFVCHWHKYMESYNPLLLPPPSKGRRSPEYFSVLEEIRQEKKKQGISEMQRSTAPLSMK